MQHLIARLLSVFLMTGTTATALSQSTRPAEPAGSEAMAWTPGDRMGLSLVAYRVCSLRAAIDDLCRTFGGRYPSGPAFRARLEDLEHQRAAGATGVAWDAALRALQREALLANPLLDLPGVLSVKRRVANPLDGKQLGMPTPHECVAMLPRAGWDNELAMLQPRQPDAPLTSVHRPPAGGYVGEVDLHWNADRLLFTQSDATNWKVWELNPDNQRVRQVSRMPADVHSHAPCYTPGGQIIFGSTAAFQSVPCWHGLRHVSTLYSMNPDGSQPRQLCFDQDHNYTPSVLPNGQVVYLRWDYTGINHIYLRQLMVMNPDGTGQRAIYGSSSWFPNSLFFPRATAADATRLVAVLSGYHGVPRMGQLVLLDVAKGWQEARGITLRISGQGDPVQPRVRDNLVDHDWPKFLHPYPLSDRYFLVSALMNAKGSWGIYLADAFDNLVLLREEPGYALLEPLPLRRRPLPPVIPSQMDPAQSEGTVYLHDVYRGPGLTGVPRGTVGKLRVLAYDFGYLGLAGPDLIGRGGPWEVMRILGTVPLEPDGSALFHVPADTPIALQPLDAEGKAVQLMRSWFSVRRGEVLSCVGCHESPAEVGGRAPALAATRRPREITPWRGPPRGFDFAREVQPVLDRNCVRCHDGGGRAKLDLRPESARPDYQGSQLSSLAIERLHPDMKRATHGRVRYTPAYEALLPYVRRVGIEDDVSLLRPGEYHADTSELIQLLSKGHYEVSLDTESWDRLATWIDLNAPCHGTWGEVFPIPDGMHERRLALRRMCGGPLDDPEKIPQIQGSRPSDAEEIRTQPQDEIPPSAAIHLPDATNHSDSVRSSNAPEANRPPSSVVLPETTLDLGAGATLRLVQIPAGEFQMGSDDGAADERPSSRVAIQRPFWMSVQEVSNEAFRQFESSHDSGYYQKRHAALKAGAPGYIGPDGRGLTLDDPRQPVVRVSWDQAMKFCQWLSRKSGRTVALPTEAEWEYACRAGTGTDLSFGDLQTDYSAWANVADASFSVGLQPGGRQNTGGLDHLVLEGAALSDRRFSDHEVVTAAVGSYRSNPWGLKNLHGNAAEWTLSDYRPYPYSDTDGRNDGRANTRKVVRGGSFFDRPTRCRSAFRLAYPAWQRVFNVGFRVVARIETPAAGHGARRTDSKPVSTDRDTVEAGSP